MAAHVWRCWAANGAGNGTPRCCAILGGLVESGARTRSILARSASGDTRQRIGILVPWHRRLQELRRLRI